MENVYDLKNVELVKAFKSNDIEKLKEIASKSIFLIPVKDKNNINKIAVEAMMDSLKDLYLPIFINMADIDLNKMIKGKNVLIAHFGMIETILNNNEKFKGIVINPCTMDCKLTRKESFDICSLYHKNEDKLDFDMEFYKKEKFTMSDLKQESIVPRANIIMNIVNYLKKTSIKKAYLRISQVGNKLHYKIYIDYIKKEQSFVDELSYIIENLLNENESFELLNAKLGINSKIVKNLKPIYEKKKH